MSDAKAKKNPVAATPENIAKGKALFEGKGTCFNCHGKKGDGQGEAGKILNPSPRNFTNCKFHKKRKDGELFWVIKNGSAGTGMVSLTPAIITKKKPGRSSTTSGASAKASSFVAAVSSRGWRIESSTLFFCLPIVWFCHGCSERSSSKAAASKDLRRTLAVR